MNAQLHALIDALSGVASELSASPSAFHRIWAAHLLADRASMIALALTWDQPDTLEAAVDHG